jgi:hypothetical protein
MREDIIATPPHHSEKKNRLPPAVAQNFENVRFTA